MKIGRLILKLAADQRRGVESFPVPIVQLQTACKSRKCGRCTRCRQLLEQWPTVPVKGSAPWPASVALRDSGRWVDWALCGTDDDVKDILREWKCTQARRWDGESLGPEYDPVAYLPPCGSDRIRVEAPCA